MVEKYGWDQTPTPDLGLDITKAPEDIQKLYKWVIQKTYGQDVASAYAQGLVAAGIIAKNAEALSLFTKNLTDDMLLEMTDKDVISAPEIIASRDGEDTLAERLNRDFDSFTERLNRDFDSFTEQLAQKALQADLEVEKSRINNLIVNAGDGTIPTELIDIRTLSDGKTYKTASEATRTISQKVDDMFEVVKNQVLETYVGYYWSNRTIGNDGTTKTADASYTCYVIPVKPNSYISANVDISGAFSNFLGADKKTINVVDGYKTSDYLYKVPSNAHWLYATRNKSTADLVAVNFDLSIAGTNYTDIPAGKVLGYKVGEQYIKMADFQTISNTAKLPKVLTNLTVSRKDKTYFNNRVIGADATSTTANNDYTAYIIKVNPLSILSASADIAGAFTHYVDADLKAVSTVETTRISEATGFRYRVPANVEWVYVTINGFTDGLLAIEGQADVRYATQKQPQAFYGFDIGGTIYPFTDTNGKVETINLKVGTDKPYKTIQDALGAVKNSNAFRVHNILLDDGTYNFSMIGGILPDYVNIIGVSGNAEKVIIKGEVPDSADDNTITNTSTINVSKNNNFENLTVTGRNCRYVVHDESGGNDRNWKRFVKNCRFIHYGNNGARNYRKANGGDASKVWEITRAWGEGASEGAYSQFDYCYFESPVQCWYVHEPNAENSTKPYHHVLNNCTFVSTQVEGGGFGGLVNIDNTRDRGGAINRIDFNNCSFANGGFSVNGDIPIKVTVHGGNEVFISASNPINYPETDYTIKRYYHSDTPLTGGEVFKYSETNHNFVELATPTTPQEAIVGIHIGTSGTKDTSVRVLMPTLFNAGLTGTFGSLMYVGADSKLTLTPGTTPVGMYLKGKDKLFKN